MITRLFIRNLVLIEEVTVHFGPGLNILSGETGAGKSALLSALGLMVGRRGDSSLVRKGADKAIVEAVFDIDRLEGVKQALSDGGISFAEGDDLIILRELHANGKGRIFINNQVASSQFLKTVGEMLVSVVSQHANQNLFSLDYHRRALDLFGGLQVQHFADEWEKEKKLAHELEELRQSEAARAQNLKRLVGEAEEIAAAKVKEGEEEELFAEYTRLIHVEDIANYCQELSDALNGDEGSLSQLKHLKRTFDKLLALDAHFKGSVEAFQGIICELQEIAFDLEKGASQSAADPERLGQINERLTLLAALKKKYGADIAAYEKKLQEDMAKLEGADIELEELAAELPRQAEKTAHLALELTAQRKKTIVAMQKRMTEQLRQLNMPNALFTITLTPQKRNSAGDDLIEWFLAPNRGENPVSVRECASGGELSRVMLALQALLGGKEQIPTLLFDEIDANIGGETATVVGEKLREIAKEHQVLCITHFPQVARQADHHFRIRKQEINERTVTLVDELAAEERNQELHRMLGISS